jgi:hypothetical protein
MDPMIHGDVRARRLLLLCRFLGRLDDEYIDALDGRRPRSAKARNRGK